MTKVLQGQDIVKGVFRKEEEPYPLDLLFRRVQLIAQWNRHL
jgi:hypothetical protein